MRQTFVAMIVLSIAAVPAMAGIVLPDLSGQWTLQATGQLPGEETPCVFQGGGSMTQTGDQVTGQATLMLVSGPAACPAEMMADLSGLVEGSAFFGTLDGGEMFGMLQFQGTIGQEETTLVGTYEVEPEGPFSGTTGTWQAMIAQSILAIPTANAATLTLLAALLAAASLLFLRQLRA